MRVIKQFSNYKRSEAMNELIVKILGVKKITHDINQIRVERPQGYSFIPGQASEVSVNKPGFKDEKRPFTFTGLTDSDELEFTIKSYKEHNGVTKQIGLLKSNDELIIRDVWGAISYKGKGTFIAGGAGVTPFISILRDLKHKNELHGNKLIFSNKTSRDIILKDELTEMLGHNFINVLTREVEKGYYFGRIDEDFLKKQIDNFNQNFYVCGPDSFVQKINLMLTEFGVLPNSITFEK